jgi:hypothetical protein
MPSAPGWYPDPWSATGSGERYFDGKRWGTTERPLGREVVVLESRRRRRVRGGRSDLGDEGEARTRRRGRALLSIAIVVALVGVAWYLQRPDSSGSASHARATGATRPGNQPPPGAEEASHRLVPPVTPPVGSGGYVFMQHQLGDPTKPVAFDPCRPIHYVVNVTGGPPDALQLVQDSVASVAAATGLRFVYDGPTSEAPDNSRAAYQPNAYSSKRWAPVLVAWSDEHADPELAGYIEGVTTPQGVRAASGLGVYVTGQVVLDDVDLSTSAQPDRTLARAVVMHELGHLVGLDHIDDPTQIMYSESRFNVRDFGDGDRRGLALVGDGPCVPGV